MWQTNVIRENNGSSRGTNDPSDSIWPKYICSGSLCLHQGKFILDSNAAKDQEMEKIKDFPGT